MRPRRVGHLGARDVAKRELGTEHRLHVKLPGRLGEADDSVQAIVIGQCDGPQVQPGGLLDELLRRARPVEEAVGRVRVQFGVGHRRTAARVAVGPLVAAALARPGGAVTPSPVGSGRRDPARRGLLVRMRSISPHVDGPSFHPTQTVYRTCVRSARAFTKCAADPRFYAPHMSPSTGIRLATSVNFTGTDNHEIDCQSTRFPMRSPK